MDRRDRSDSAGVGPGGDRGFTARRTRASRAPHACFSRATRVLIARHMRVHRAPRTCSSRATRRPAHWPTQHDRTVSPPSPGPSSGHLLSHRSSPPATDWMRHDERFLIDFFLAALRDSKNSAFAAVESEWVRVTGSVSVAEFSSGAFLNRSPAQWAVRDRYGCTTTAQR